MTADDELSACSLRAARSGIARLYYIALSLLSFLLLSYVLRTTLWEFGLKDYDLFHVAVTRVEKQHPDILFVGSSHFDFGIDNDLFDHELRKNNINMNSAMIYLPGLSFAEARSVIEDFLNTISAVLG